jgi:hypothetical protein
MAVRLSKEDCKRLGIEPPKKPAKYHAERTPYNGVTYDSKAEAEYAKHLDWLMSIGKVCWWLRQVKMPISGSDDKVPEFYRVDFLVAFRSKSWRDLVRIEAHEVKGKELKGFARVKKAWDQYGLVPLKIIKKGEISEEIYPASMNPAPKIS